MNESEKVGSPSAQVENKEVSPKDAQHGKQDSDQDGYEDELGSISDFELDGSSIGTNESGFARGEFVDFAEKPKKHRTKREREHQSPKSLRTRHLPHAVLGGVVESFLVEPFEKRLVDLVSNEGFGNFLALVRTALPEIANTELSGKLNDFALYADILYIASRASIGESTFSNLSDIWEKVLTFKVEEHRESREAFVRWAASLPGIARAPSDFDSIVLQSIQWMLVTWTNFSALEALSAHSANADDSEFGEGMDTYLPFQLLTIYEMCNSVLGNNRDNEDSLVLADDYDSFFNRMYLRDRSLVDSIINKILSDLGGFLSSSQPELLDINRTALLKLNSIEITRLLRMGAIVRMIDKQQAQSKRKPSRFRPFAPRPTEREIEGRRFRVTDVLGDGNCGFRALGLERSEMIELFLAAFTDHSASSTLAGAASESQTELFATIRDHVQTLIFAHPSTYYDPNHPMFLPEESFFSYLDNHAAYVRDVMSRSAYWPQGETLGIFAQFKKRNIQFYQLNGGKVIPSHFAKNGDDYPTWYIFHVDNNHFQILTPIETETAPLPPVNAGMFPKKGADLKVDED